MKGKKLKKIHIIFSKDYGCLTEKDGRLIFNKKLPYTSNGVLHSIDLGLNLPKFFSKEEAEKILKEVKETRFIEVDNVKIKKLVIYRSYINKILLLLQTKKSLIREFERTIRKENDNKDANNPGRIIFNSWRTKNYEVSQNIILIFTIAKTLNPNYLELF